MDIIMVVFFNYITNIYLHRVYENDYNYKMNYIIHNLSLYNEVFRHVCNLSYYKYMFDILLKLT